MTDSFMGEKYEKEANTYSKHQFIFETSNEKMQEF